MIKKLLTILFSLIVLCVLGLAALLFWVSPNHYKSFIADAVKEKTGYELTISGDLHWHIWPKINLLSEGVTLKDPAAKKPLLIADNMRFDVELWPLFSKKLVITDVFVKAATVTLTDETSNENVPKTPVSESATTPPSTHVQSQTTSAKPAASSANKNEFDNVLDKMSWLSDLNKLQIVDSVVVYQSQQDLINLRNINLTVLQKVSGIFSVDFSGHINRNQKDIKYHLVSDLNMQRYPESVSLPIEKLTMSFTGAGMPESGINGQFVGAIDYVPAAKKISSNNVEMTINGNQLKGKMAVTLDKRPAYSLNLATDHFSLLPFLAPAKKSETAKTQSKTTAAKSTSGNASSVVINQAPSSNALAFLRDFDATFVLTARKLTTPSVIMTDVIVEGNNQQGILTIRKMNGKFAEGQINVSGQANGRVAKERVGFHVNVQNMNSDRLFDTLKIEKSVSGLLNMTGDFVANSVTATPFFSQLTGNMALQFDQVRFNKVDFSQIIQPLSLLTKEKLTADSLKQYTQFRQISSQAKLAGGMLNFSSVQANSDALNVTGQGWLNTAKNSLDFKLNAKVLKVLNDNSKTLNQLKNVLIPLRVYGPFSQIKYDVNIEQILKQEASAQLTEKVNKEIDRFLNKLGSKDEAKKTPEKTPNQEKSPKENTRDQLKSGLKDLLKQL